MTASSKYVSTCFEEGHDKADYFINGLPDAYFVETIVKNAKVVVKMQKHRRFSRQVFQQLSARQSVDRIVCNSRIILSWG